MRTRLFSRVVGSAFVLLVMACSSSQSDGSSGNASSSSSSSSSSGGAGPNASSSSSSSSSGGNGACTNGASICIGHAARRACVNGAWVDETCAAGSGCFQGACTPNKCSDECTLGDKNSAGKSCTAVSVKGGSGGAQQLDPNSKLHDRARDYLGWMKRGSMATGAIGSAHFSDPPNYVNIDAMHGIGDSAIWTGTFLASEAFRLEATGSSDARARVRSLVDTMHLWLNVAGEPGMLVRWAKPSATTFSFNVPDYDCSNERVHCNIDYKGTKYDFIGHISRDQYQGVMLGLANAYDALSPEIDEDKKTRAIIRADIVTIVKELMKERTLPVRITFNGTKLPATNVTARFVVVSPREMVNGAIDLRVSTSNAADDSEMYGFQEFYPNLADLVRQIPGLGFAPDIKRASSAIMLTSFFRTALHVTKDDPAFAKDHAEILAYYTGHAGQGGNVKDWLDVAKGWSEGNNNCGNAYYANNITMMPLYTLARLEDDPERAKTIKSDVLVGKMWPTFENTKNSFFSFIYAGVITSASPSVTTSATEQIKGFPVAPRVRRPIDLRNDPKYPTREANCSDQVGHETAVDVSDRVTADFMWQRHPWGLYEAGDMGQTEPALDYLIAYFMGRHHKFIEDDTPETCLAWQ